MHPIHLGRKKSLRHVETNLYEPPCPDTRDQEPNLEITAHQTRKVWRQSHGILKDRDGVKGNDGGSAERLTHLYGARRQHPTSRSDVVIWTPKIAETFFGLALEVNGRLDFVQLLVDIRVVFWYIF